MSSISLLFFFFSGSWSSGTPSRKMRNLDDLYEITNSIDDDVILYCHLGEVIKDAKWKFVIDEEIASIEKDDTWRLVPKPNGKKSIGVKSIYKDNKNVKEKVERYKARLMKKSYSQKHWIDYDKIFAHVARLETIQLIIVTATQHR